jgi:hypothetical protein
MHCLFVDSDFKAFSILTPCFSWKSYSGINIIILLTFPAWDYLQVINCSVGLVLLSRESESERGGG